MIPQTRANLRHVLHPPPYSNVETNIGLMTQWNILRHIHTFYWNILIVLLERFISFFWVSVVQVILVKVHSHKGIWDTHHCSHPKLPSFCQFSQQKQTAPGIWSLSDSCSILVTSLSQPSESSTTSHHAAIAASHTQSGHIEWNVIFFFFSTDTT